MVFLRLALRLLAVLLSVELRGKLNLLVVGRILVDLALVVGRNLFDLLVVEQHALARIVVGGVHRRSLDPRVDSARRLGLLLVLAQLQVLVALGVFVVLVVVGALVIDLGLLVGVDGLGRVGLRVLLLGVRLDRLGSTLLLEGLLVSDGTHFALGFELLVDDADVFCLLQLVGVVLGILGVRNFQRSLRDHGDHREAHVEVVSGQEGALVEAILVVAVTLADQIGQDLLGLKLVVRRHLHGLLRRIRVELLEL